MVPKEVTKRDERPAPRYPVESVANAAKILLLFQSEPRLRLSDVADALEVSPSTAHRLLTTLASVDMVTQEEPSRLYAPGAALMSLASALAPSENRWEWLAPFLRDLSRRVGETVHVITLQGGSAVFVAGVEADQALRVGSRVGVSMPAHCTSAGKVLLAELSRADLDARFPSERLETRTPASIATRSDLFAELGLVRRRKWASNIRETEPDVAALAVGIPGQAPPIAIAVSAPPERLPKSRFKEVVAELLKTASAVQAYRSSATTTV